MQVAKYTSLQDTSILDYIISYFYDYIIKNCDSNLVLKKEKDTNINKHNKHIFIHYNNERVFSICIEKKSGDSIVICLYREAKYNVSGRFSYFLSTDDKDCTVSKTFLIYTDFYLDLFSRSMKLEIDFFVESEKLDYIYDNIESYMRDHKLTEVLKII